MKKNICFCTILLFVLSEFLLLADEGKQLLRFREKKDKPRIVNIINFIRLLEPRDRGITEDILYETVVEQVEIMKKYNLKGTFLLQYDALLDSRYQQLLKNLPDSSFEIGAWWEIPQPLVENAGMKWRGRFPWDWHANIGFSVGYTPREREKLIDVYMEDFKKIFGYYPKSVGSWFIDAHSLAYMYDNYHIVASCNCKDQIGTDGYTLWGGYWNQGYYPSRKNAYMPAQHEENQISIPIFRMLGSDPIRQYDKGLGSNRQGVVSLEPVYREGGGDSVWVNWYFKEFIDGECLEYAYVQVGQENSFTWEQMSKGFNIQMPLIAHLRDEKKIRVETLAETGEWFREKYKITPATSVSVTEDIPGSNRKTIWFNSRYYRSNLLWENDSLRFRDIHLFDEDFQSDYLKEIAISDQCSYYTLPFVDGFLWSSLDKKAGLYFSVFEKGKESLLRVTDFHVSNPKSGTLRVNCPLQSFDNDLSIDMDEQNIEIKMKGEKIINWFLKMDVGVDKVLPFKNISPSQIECQFKGFDYFVTALKGSFLMLNNRNVFIIMPEDNIIKLNLSKRKKL